MIRSRQERQYWGRAGGQRGIADIGQDDSSFVPPLKLTLDLLRNRLSVEEHTANGDRDFLRKIVLHNELSRDPRRAVVSIPQRLGQGFGDTVDGGWRRLNERQDHAATASDTDVKGGCFGAVNRTQVKSDTILGESFESLISAPEELWSIEALSQRCGDGCAVLGASRFCASVHKEGGRRLDISGPFGSGYDVCGEKVRGGFVLTTCQHGRSQNDAEKSAHVYPLGLNRFQNPIAEAAHRSSTVESVKMKDAA